MKNKYRQWAAIIFSTILFSCLILDGQTALLGALDGVQICIYTIIPTLFPYIFLSSLLCSYSLGRQVPLIAALARRCGVPSGAESIFLLGFVGGYPVGAKLVTDSYRQGHLSKSSAQRMLGFCSNAGPSFIFWDPVHSVFKAVGALVTLAHTHIKRRRSRFDFTG